MPCDLTWLVCLEACVVIPPPDQPRDEMCQYMMTARPLLGTYHCDDTAMNSLVPTECVHLNRNEVYSAY